MSGSGMGMLVHTYKGGIYVGTNRYPSKRAMTKALRDNGIQFRTGKICSLDDNSVFLHKGDLLYEIEEQCGDVPALTFQGKTYIPIMKYCQMNGLSRRHVFYKYHSKQLEGITIGKRGLVYIRCEEDNK